MAQERRLWSKAISALEAMEASLKVMEECLDKALGNMSPLRLALVGEGGNMKRKTKIESPIPAAPAKISVGSLENGEKFRLRGALYRKQSTVPSGIVIAVHLHKAHYSSVETPRERVELQPSTEVERVG